MPSGRKPTSRGTSLLQPVRDAPRLPDLIAEQVIELIRAGDLAAGDRLPTEAELARELGVGRTSVREGLGKLRAIGVIEVRKGRGAFVADAECDMPPLTEFVRWATTNAVAVEELVEARVALEALAAPLAAVRADPDQVAAIRVYHEAHLRAGEPLDVDALVYSDEGFHQAIMDAAGSQVVGRMYEFLIGELQAYRRQTLSLPWAPARSAKGHAAILKAIEQRNPVRARRAMIDHLWIVSSEIHETVGETEAGLPLPPRAALG